MSFEPVTTVEDSKTPSPATPPDARQLLRNALENSWQKYTTELERCRSEFSEEAVHDLRVAMRRLLALLRLVNSIVPRKGLGKMIRRLKKQLDQFDALRDTQVILEALPIILSQIPSLADFQNYLQSHEDELLDELQKKVKKFKVSAIEKRLGKTRAAIENDTSPDLEAQMLEAVDDAFLRTRIRMRWVDLTRPATIHRVRVAFKSFRYMVEIVCPLLKDFPDENLKRMDKYQTRMGEIQDTEVFIQSFTDFAESTSLAETEPVRHFYEGRRIQAISAYVKDMQKLQDFWRPHPDGQFPWQKEAV